MLVKLCFAALLNTNKMVERQLISLASQLQLIDRLQHLIYLSSSLIFVSGEQGSGKSTLIEQLSNKLPGNIQQVFIQLNDQSADAQIRQQIITQLYKQPLFDAQDSLLSSISMLQKKHKRDLPRLIILDHAHYLSADLLLELLQIITHKEQFGESDINVLLIASEHDNHRMRAFIDAASLTQKLECTCLEFRVEALTVDEASSLLNHIFKQAQYQPKIQHQDALHKQLTACAGNPQKIIHLAERISAGEFKDSELSWLKMRFPAIVLMFFLLITVAGLADYLYPKFFSPSKAAIEVVETIEDETMLLSAISATQLTGDEPAAQQALPELVEKLAGSWSNKTSAEIKDNQLAVGISDAGVKRVIISEQQILNLSDPAEEADAELTEIKDIQEAQPENIQSEEKSAVLDALVTDIEQVSDQGAVVAEVNILEVQDRLENGPQAGSTLSDNREPKTAVAAEKQAEFIDREADTIFTASAQLLARAPAHFTLQLSAMESEKTLQAFILAHKLPQPGVYIYQTIRNNNPWYVVIFGDYESLPLAKKASRTLPGSLAKMTPWIKKYQLVHQDLRLNNE